MLASPSTFGAKGRPKWGVAILVRARIGLRWPFGGGVIVPSRIIKSGTGMCDRNVSYLKAIGRTLEHDKLFVVGGDWNLDPAL
eukprot:2549540-Pyramimonas_sp.AAC.1